MIDAFCDRLTFIIKKNVQGIDNEKAEIINFGLRSIVSEITKLTIILLSAYLFGVFNYVIIVIASHGLYKTYAGGFHAKTHLMCLITSMVIIYSNILLSVFLISDYYYINIIYALIYIFNCLIIYFYAPADVEEKPIISKKLRRKLKRKAFIVMNLIFIIACVVLHNRAIANLLILSTLFVSITLMPISYRVMGCKYGHKGNIQ